MCAYDSHAYATRITSYLATSKECMRFVRQYSRLGLQIIILRAAAPTFSPGNETATKFKSFCDSNLCLELVDKVEEGRKRAIAHFACLSNKLLKRWHALQAGSIQGRLQTEV